MNTIGKNFSFTSFGESHGKGVGGIVDGCPSGIELDEQFIQNELRRRRPGQSSVTTPREEEDKIEFLSGIFEGKSTGVPITFVIWNKNQQSEDYNHLKDVFRPSHADFTYQQKYGIRDHRGGGRSSARTTAGWVAAGAIAKLILKQKNIDVAAYTSQVGHISVGKDYTQLDLSQIESNVVRCPEKETASKMIEYIEKLRNEGNSIGGTVTCVVKGVPVGWGEPVFDKLQARLAAAMLSINATHGFDYGKGFEGIGMTGAELNDSFVMKEGEVSTATNHSGGIQGGISNGQDIYFRVLFKAVSTISQKQTTLNKELKQIELEAKGRHDPCVLPRAVPIVEAMAAITLVDMYLASLR
jgi:chorismate synthase